MTFFHQVTGHVALSIALTLCYLLIDAAYNVLFHPFRKVPGPKLYAVSRLPWIRDWLSGNIHLSVQKLHETYGDMVRIAPDEISCIRSDAWADIYGHKGQRSFTRDFKWYARLTEGQDDIIVSSESDHARFRKALGASFSDKTLKENEHVMMRNIQLLVSKLKSHTKVNSSVANMVKWYNFMTFDVIGDLVYGSTFGCLENEDYHPWLGVVLQNIRLSSYGALMERYPILKWVAAALVPKSLMEKRNMHVGIIREKLSQRSQKPPSHRDVVSDVTENGMVSQKEMEANLALITMAGSETSATALSAVTYYLCRNKDVDAKLKKEIRSSIKEEKDMTWDNIKDLPYLLATIKEALRLYPPTPVGLPRRLMSNGTTVCGQYIPKNAVVYITQYSAYRAETNFRDAKQFRPERWLGDDYFSKDQREVFQPFITGAYSCIGKSLAYMEMSLALAMMVWNFDWALADGSDDMFEREQVYALWQKSALNVRLVERLK